MSGFELRVSGFEFHLFAEFGAESSGFQVAVVGCVASDFGRRAPGFGARVPDSGCIGSGSHVYSEFRA